MPKKIGHINWEINEALTNDFPGLLRLEQLQLKRMYPNLDFFTVEYQGVKFVEKYEFIEELSSRVHKYEIIAWEYA